MIKFLWHLIWGDSCKHKWEIIEKTNIYDCEFNGGRMPVGMRYTQQCMHCGKLKTFRNS
jgi:hypothetical protein